jgi:hypothetical protein
MKYYATSTFAIGARLDGIYERFKNYSSNFEFTGGIGALISVTESSFVGIAVNNIAQGERSDRRNAEISFATELAQGFRAEAGARTYVGFKENVFVGILLSPIDILQLKAAVAVNPLTYSCEVGGSFSSLSIAEQSCFTESLGWRIGFSLGYSFGNAPEENEPESKP